MAEHQVSIGRQTFRLPELFLVMATQNIPIEQEGTYPLPEAQLDRFLLHVKVDYPSADAEHRILDLGRRETLTPAARDAPPARLSAADVLEARARVLGRHMAASVQEYLVQLIVATRHPERYDAELGDLLEYGASPRGSIALDHLARAAAWFVKGHRFATCPITQGALFRFHLRAGVEATAESAKLLLKSDALGPRAQCAGGPPIPVVDLRRRARRSLSRGRGGIRRAGAQQSMTVPIRPAPRVSQPVAFAVTLEPVGGVVVSDRSHLMALARAGGN